MRRDPAPRPLGRSVTSLFTQIPARRADLGWLENIRRLNGQPFLRAHVNQVLDINLYTDAGGRGWGAVLAVPPEGTVAQSVLLDVVSSRLLPNMSIQAVASALRTGLKLCGTFTEAEQKEGSNVRELLATKYAFHALCPALTHLRMDHLVDNSGVAQAYASLTLESLLYTARDSQQIDQFGQFRTLRHEA